MIHDTLRAGLVLRHFLAPFFIFFRSYLRRPMPFVQPAYNLIANIWHEPHTSADPPDAQIICNLSPGRLQSQIWEAIGPELVNTFFFMLLRCPRGTDIRDSFSSPTIPDFVEVPAWSGRLYSVLAVEDIGGGFDNEHRVAAIRKTDNWPTPMPDCTGPYYPPPPPPPPPAAAANVNTGGIPVNALACGFTLAIPSVVSGLLCWEGGLGLMQPGSAFGAAGLGGTLQSQTIGGVTYNSVAITYGILPAGVYPDVFTFPMAGVGQMQIILMAFPGALSLTNGIASGIGAVILAGTTALTTIAPNPVILGGLEINPTGASVAGPPSVIVGVPQNEAVGVANVRAIMLTQPGPVNAAYLSSTFGDGPGNTSWWTYMQG